MSGSDPVVSTLTHDAVARCFRRDALAVDLTPKAYALLVALTRTPGRLVSKQELLNEVWPGVVVGEAVLKVVVNEIRRALGDDAQSPRFIATAHRRGYRFVGECDGCGAASSRPALAGRGAALEVPEQRVERAPRG